MNIHSSFLPIRSNSFSPVLTHVYCSIEFYDIEKQVGRFPSCGLGLYTLSFSFSTILFLSSADAEYIYYIIYYLILSQNFSSADAEYIILYYIPLSQSKIFLLLTQNILYILYTPFPSQKFFFCWRRIYNTIYIIYPSPVKKINFSAVAAILRQFSPKLPPNSPFFPQSPPQKISSGGWRRQNPNKTRQNPKMKKNDRTHPYTIYYITTPSSSLLLLIYIYIYIYIYI